MPVSEEQRALTDLEDLLGQSPQLSGELPVRPEEPLSRDCCGQSCSPCVYDIHRVELEQWAKRCWRHLRPNEQEEQEEQMEHGPALFSLQPNVYQSLRLISVTPMTEDTNVYRFALPTDHRQLFLPVGTHVIMKGLNVVRQYTPITDPDTVGYIDLMIKLYPHGLMSHCLRGMRTRLENGEEVRAEFRGPFGLFTYAANSYADLLMFAAGTGLAPMAQIIRHVLTDERDNTRIRLLLCCRRYQHIPLKQQLGEWSRHWNFSVRYVLSQWRNEQDRQLSKYGEELVCGHRLSYDHVTEELERVQHFEQKRSMASSAVQPAPAFQVLICGTKSFEKDVMNYFMKAGTVAKRIFRF